MSKLSYVCLTTIAKRGRNEMSRANSVDFPINTKFGRQNRTRRLRVVPPWVGLVNAIIGAMLLRCDTDFGSLFAGVGEIAIHVTIGFSKSAFDFSDGGTAVCSI